MGQPRIGATRFHSSGRYSHDVGACRRGDGDADSDESVECRSIAVATVPVLFAESVEDAEPPPLGVRERPVDPWHDDVGGHLADDARRVALAVKTVVALVVVGRDVAAPCDVHADEPLQHLAAVVGYDTEPNAATAECGQACCLL